MKLLARLSSGARAYPWKERLPLAVGTLCVMLWARRMLGIYPQAEDYVFMGGWFLALLCRRGGRPFWFLVGIATGPALVGGLILLNSKSRAFCAGGIVIMAAVAWLIRGLGEEGTVQSEIKKTRVGNPRGRKGDGEKGEKGDRRIF